MQSIYINILNVILNKSVSKLFTILTKCFFFTYLNPTSYIKTDDIKHFRDCIQLHNN